MDQQTHSNPSFGGALARATALLLCGALVAASPTLAQAGSPCAPQATGSVVTFGSGNVSGLDVALFPDGSGIAVWAESGDGSRQGVFAQRIGVDGMPQGSSFVVNTFTEQDQFDPAVAVAPNGRIVVVWTSDLSPGDDENSSIRGRVLAPSGQALGPDFQVNSSPFGPQRDSDVAMAEDGSFVAVWYDDSDAPGSSQMNGREVRARRFRSDGSALGPDFIVNNRRDGTQDNPAIAMAAGGDFVVVFSTSRDSPGSDTNRSIQARLYSDDGAPKGGQFQVNNVTENTQTEPAVAMDPDGSFLVVWRSASSAGSDQDGNSIQARGYTRTGAATGPQQQVNEVGTKSQFEPQVGAAGGREFLVAWNSRAVDDRVKARSMTLEAQPQGTEFRAGGFSNDRSFHAAVAGNGAGRTIVLFERDQVVRGQAYDLPCVAGGGVTDCVETATNLCLNSDRFKVTVLWRTRAGDVGQGQAIELTPDTGYFWFFDSANVESVVKVLDACALNDRYWVFIGGLTDLNVEFVIEDVESSVIRRYENPQATAFATVNDTDAFATCP